MGKQSYQVFLMASPIPVPFSFAIHAWFVCCHEGKLERWEFGKFNGSPHPNSIGVLHDFMPPLLGMNKFPGRAKPRHNSYLLGIEAGGMDSRAAAMLKFIQRYSPEYPLRRQYRYLGPNSNTYVAWVLRHFPETDLNLNWRAIGRNFKAPLIKTVINSPM